MPEIIINSSTLPESIFRLIKTEKVKVRELNGEIRIVPVSGNTETDRFLAIKQAAVEAENKMQRLYMLCGSGVDLDMTVDSFLAMTHDEKELSSE